jgi:hypothetical protein
MGKKYKIAILSKDRQRCLTIVTTADAADELLKIIAPGCPSASASGLVFQKHLLRRWKRALQRSEILRIEAHDYVDVIDAFGDLRWYLDAL